MQFMALWNNNAAHYICLLLSFIIVLTLPAPSLLASMEPEPLQYCHPYSVLSLSPATRFSSSTNSPTGRALWSEGNHTGVRDRIGPSEPRRRWRSVYRSWGGVLMLRSAETAWTERRSNYTAELNDEILRMSKWKWGFSSVLSPFIFGMELCWKLTVSSRSLYFTMIVSNVRLYSAKKVKKKNFKCFLYY